MVKWYKWKANLWWTHNLEYGYFQGRIGKGWGNTEEINVSNHQCSSFHDGGGFLETSYGKTQTNSLANPNILLKQTKKIRSVQISSNGAPWAKIF